MIAVTRILNVQERRGKDIVFLKMMKILMKAQKGPANVIRMLKTTISITQHKVHNLMMHAITMVLLINPQIKVNKNWMVSLFLINM